MNFDFLLDALWMHEIFYWIWILKIHVWKYEIWFLFFVLFFNGEFMKEWNFLLNLNFEFQWKCMFEYIQFDFFVLLEECIYECMKVWLNMNFRFQWKCMFECMKFDYLFFLKNAYINSWNFVNFLNENACLNAWIFFFVFFICFF